MAPEKHPDPASREPPAARPRRRRPSPTGVTRDPERTSAAILDAAIREFSEKGYGGARIEAVAARAGVNKRMIYHYFGGKDELYGHALKEIYRAIRSAEARLALTTLEPEDAIRELARFTWTYFCDTPEFLAMLAAENLNRARALKQASWREEVNSSLIGDLSAVLKRGAEKGVFRPGLDAVDVYVTMVGAAWFRLSNKYTLSAAFGRDFLGPDANARWGEHMAEVTLAWLHA